MDIRELKKSEKILRTVRLGIAAGRLPESTGSAIPDIVERLRLFRDGRPNQAAVVLFGSRFMPDFPQCQLRLARFRGVNKSEFLDQRQIEGNAFYLLRKTSHTFVDLTLLNRWGEVGVRFTD